MLKPMPVSMLVNWTAQCCLFVSMVPGTDFCLSQLACSIEYICFVYILYISKHIHKPVVVIATRLTSLCATRLATVISSFQLLIGFLLSFSKKFLLTLLLFLIFLSFSEITPLLYFIRNTVLIFFYFWTYILSNFLTMTLVFWEIFFFLNR